MEQGLARWAHNPKAGGSNPSPAIFLLGGIAQSVEQRNHNPRVIGSIPVAAMHYPLITFRISMKKTKSLWMTILVVLIQLTPLSADMFPTENTPKKLIEEVTYSQKGSMSIAQIKLNDTTIWDYAYLNAKEFLELDWQLYPGREVTIKVDEDSSLFLLCLCGNLLELPVAPSKDTPTTAFLQVVSLEPLLMEMSVPKEDDEVVVYTYRLVLNDGSCWLIENSPYIFDDDDRKIGIVDYWKVGHRILVVNTLDKGLHLINIDVPHEVIYEWHDDDTVWGISFDPRVIEKALPIVSEQVDNASVQTIDNQERIFMKLCLDKVKMNVIKTAENGVVNHETIFLFSQKNDLVLAEYAGGKIRQGFLVGQLSAENQLTFSYCQMQTDGTLDNGVSICELSKNENGKITLTENFEWKSRPGEFGTNIFQEI